MRRTLPPAPPSTALTTRAGFERLQTELDRLWRHERPEVVRALAAAAAEGDRSENAEYIYRKKQLYAIDRRVRFLSKRIPELRIVDTAPSDPGAVYFGAWIELARLDASEGAEGAEGTLRYRIVGPDETDARTGCISIDSPLARALLRKRVGDTAIAMLPGGPAKFELLEISYQP